MFIPIEFASNTYAFSYILHLDFLKFDKRHAICANVGGVLTWVECYPGWHGWHAFVSGALVWVVWVNGCMGDVLAWVARLCGWRASVGGVGAMLPWVAWMMRFRG